MTPIERVARALFPAVFELPRVRLYQADYDEAYRLARVAIEAMREPTDAMGAAGIEADTEWDEVNVRGIYRAMIDAALEDNP